MAIPKRGSKRAASASPARRPAKKRPAADPALVACAAVIEALGDSNLPLAVTAALKKMAPHCLRVAKANRDTFQTETVETIGKAMNGIKEAKAATISLQRAKVDNAPQEKVARDAAVATAEGNVASCQAALESSKQRLAEANAAVKAAKDTVKANEAAQEADEENISAADEKKKVIEKTASEAFDVLREQGNAAKQAGRKVSMLAKVGKTCGFDSTLVLSLGFALKKDPAMRSPVDAFLIEQLQNEIANNISNVNKVLAEGEETKATRNAAAESAKAELENAMIAGTACKTALADAGAALKEAEKTLAQAKERQDTYLIDMKDTMDKLDELTADLRDFEASALDAFSLLVDLVEPEEEQDVEPEKVADEPVGDPAVQDMAGTEEVRVD